MRGYINITELDLGTLHIYNHPDLQMKRYVYLTSKEHNLFSLMTFITTLLQPKAKQHSPLDN